MNKTMEKKIYEKPDVECFEELYEAPLCGSGNPDGSGEDFEWEI